MDQEVGGSSPPSCTNDLARNQSPKKRFQQRSLDLGVVHMSREERDNRPRDLVLDRENVVEFAVVPLSPAVGAGHGVDELRRDADAVAAPPDATFQNVACAQLPIANCTMFLWSRTR